MTDKNRMVSDAEESESSEKSNPAGEEEEEEGEESRRRKEEGKMTEYEKKRLSRIAENKARMEALGLRTIASSLSSSKPQSRRNTRCKAHKGKVDHDDEDYIPIDDDDEEEDEEDYMSTKSRCINKGKNKSATSMKKLPTKMDFIDTDFVDEDDVHLMQAIALSLQDSTNHSTFTESKRNARVQEASGSKKRNKSFNSRVKMTEDEVVLHFFQFDDAGKGNINVRDLRKVVIAHDFTWTDKELADMIQCFDSDGDGKLDLDDFRKIVGRCNMIQGPETC